MLFGDLPMLSCVLKASGSCRAFKSVRKVWAIKCALSYPAKLCNVIRRSSEKVMDRRHLFLTREKHDPVRST